MLWIAILFYHVAFRSRVAVGCAVKFLSKFSPKPSTILKKHQATTPPAIYDYFHNAEKIMNSTCAKQLILLHQASPLLGDVSRSFQS